MSKPKKIEGSKPKKKGGRKAKTIKTDKSFDELLKIASNPPKKKSSEEE